MSDTTVTEANALRAALESRDAQLSRQNAGLAQMARDRDALRAEVEALKVERDVADRECDRLRAQADADRQELTRLAEKVARLEGIGADLLAVAQGCTDYGGGHHDACYDAFQDGIGTVVHALKKRLAGGDDYQMRVLKAIGSGAVIVDGSAPALTVAELQRESYETACAKGWHDEDETPPAPIRVIAWMGLVCSEAAEAIEDARKGRMATTIREDGKPEGLGSELADIVIRVCDSAGALGINMEAELRAKLAFNRTRSHKHGGKLA